MRNPPLLVTMNAPPGSRSKSRPGPAEYLALDDWNAGIVALNIFGKQYPNVRMSDLPGFARYSTLPVSSMGGFFDFVSTVSDFAGRQIGNIGSVVADTSRTAGGFLGDGIRLLTDEKVVDGASRLASAGSGAITGIPGGDSIMSFIKALGSNFKTDVAAQSGAPAPANWVPWAAGGAGLLVVVMLLRPRGRR